MKALVKMFVLMFSQNVYANSACFDNAEVAEVIATSKSIDSCFATLNDNCDLKKLSLEDQKSVNRKRLVPINRIPKGNSEKNLMNKGTGVVTVRFTKSDDKESEVIYEASAEKISSCHIITSAHTFYANAEVPVEGPAPFSVEFRSGQTCDANNPFASKTSARIFFKMTEKDVDFVCSNIDNFGRCKERGFKGNSDLVILKLERFDSSNAEFFSLDTSPPIKATQLINCFGYPGAQNQRGLFLWGQEGAQMFGDVNGKSIFGVSTNAMSYKGMSGGGCTLKSDPKKLIGLFSGDNFSNGPATIDPVDKSNKNFLSPFHILRERYRKITGKSLADLDKECK